MRRERARDASALVASMGRMRCRGAGAPKVKLLHLKRTKKSGIVIRDVPAEAASLNHRDCFVLDCGHRVYTWRPTPCTAGGGLTQPK